MKKNQHQKFNTSSCLSFKMMMLLLETYYHCVWCYLCLFDHQPALGAPLHVLSAQRLPQTNLHFNATSCGLTTVHHLTRDTQWCTLQMFKTTQNISQWASLMIRVLCRWMVSEVRPLPPDFCSHNLLIIPLFWGHFWSERPLTSTISLISLCDSSLSSFKRAVPMGLSLRRKPLRDDTQHHLHVFTQ